MQTESVTSQGICNHSVAHHALVRMQQRGINLKQVEMVLRYGRTVFSRGLAFRVVGKNEVRRFKELGLNLIDCEGIHVLVDATGTVITTYKNSNLRKIRLDKRKHAMHH